jgi:diadenosine tetraphosphatase ApaH/serine/threonine PP2A family protein phosphatase
VRGRNLDWSLGDSQPVKAIVSDIHGNLEALTAVLEDIQSRGIEEIVCLGDVVGYGPAPLECLKVARGFKLSILGNHEEAVLFRAGSKDFRVKAEMAIEWTKKQLFEVDTLGAQESLKFLHSLQETVLEDNVLYVHGSPRQPLRDYVYPKDIRNEPKMQEIFGHFEKSCFCGHTHLPGVFQDDLTFIHPEDLPMGVYLTGKEKVMVNVGSVGQPRDGDRRACYATFDGDAVVFRRVDYDVDQTVKKVYATKELDRSLGDRLRAGK